MPTLRNWLFKATHPPLGGGVLLFLLSILLIDVASAARPTSDTKTINPTLTSNKEFVPPQPGSYELFNIMKAPDGRVLDIEGRHRQLAEFTGGKITLLSFIYSHCADPDGCPYAYVIFHNLKNRLEREARFRDKVRLVSLSFDPKRDTPEMLKLYAGDNARSKLGVEWEFLTTASFNDLIPILDDYGQDVSLNLDPVTQKPLGTLSHVLKVFLIDQNHVVREIYTTAYLKPDIVYNDIVTLLMEHGFTLDGQSN
jgi:protein SCO1/2